MLQVSKTLYNVSRQEVIVAPLHCGVSETHVVNMMGTFVKSMFVIVLLVEIQQCASDNVNSSTSSSPIIVNVQTGNCTLPGLERCTCSWVSGNHSRLDSIQCSDIGFSNMSFLNNPRIGDSVKTIVFTGNNLTVLDVSVLKSAVNLKLLNLSSNNIRTVMADGFSQLPRLEKLILNNNNWLVEKDTKPVFHNVSLKELHLTNAFARKYNATMRHVAHLRHVFCDTCMLGSLEKLYLASNNLYFVVSEVFCNMPKLRYLDLSHNHISELPCNATCLPALQHLLIQNNSLNHISTDCIYQMQPPPVGTIKFKLNIIHNPFICDCKMRYQYEWMMNDSTHFYDNEKDKLVCHFPDKLAGKPILHLQSSDFVCPPYPSGNKKLFVPIVIGLLLALIGVGILLIIFSKRQQIRNLCRGRHNDTSMMTAGYTSMDA